MKSFTEYTPEELAVDNLFIRWVMFPKNTAVAPFWENWIDQHPEKAETVIEAKALIKLAMEWPPAALSTQETTSIWGRIRASIDEINESEKLTSGKFANRATFVGWSILLALAATAAYLMIVK